MNNLTPFAKRLLTEIVTAANETLPMTSPEVILSVRLRVVQTTTTLPHWELTLVDKTWNQEATREGWDV
jgi:hypothetical protein